MTIHICSGNDPNDGKGVGNYQAEKNDIGLEVVFFSSKNDQGVVILNHTLGLILDFFASYLAIGVIYMISAVTVLYHKIRQYFDKSVFLPITQATQKKFSSR